jgi:hypothetical protein
VRGIGVDTALAATLVSAVHVASFGSSAAILARVDLGDRGDVVNKVKRGGDRSVHCIHPFVVGDAFALHKLVIDDSDGKRASF